MKRKFTVEFAVDEVWIDDGFNMTDEIALDMLTTALPWANADEELTATVVKTEDIED